MILDDVMNELLSSEVRVIREAIAAARNEALEAAARCYEEWAAENCQLESPTPEKRIRALKKVTP